MPVLHSPCHISTRIGERASARFPACDISHSLISQVRISHQKQDYSTVQSKCGSKANLHHTPKGGEKKVSWRGG